MIKWSTTYAVGFREIDEQHQKFFATFNELYDAFLLGEEADKVGAILNELTDYIEHHFVTEEKYFREFQYEATAEHIEQHDIFRNQISEFKKHFQKTVDRKGLADELVELLDSWLVEHLVKMDQKYVECFKEHGLT